ncbi:MAG: SDR family oxidoreductase [Bacteroidia bacterium]|nr:SDR family oxidoreductase [Bacteroidia bacterium]
MNIQGKNILVTGGGGFGVGSGVCQAVTVSGGKLFINEISAEKAEAAAKKYPGSVPVVADVTDPVQIEQMFKEINQTYGPVDGLVNNAGIGLSKNAHEATEQEFSHLYDVDIKGVWQMSKTFVNQLLSYDKPGAIVNISSVHAKATSLRYALYCSAKNAVEGLTKGMAVELGKKNIRVNAVGPGLVDAEQNYDLIRTWDPDPEKWIHHHTHDQQVLRHLIQAIDVGYAVVFLLSDMSRSITGQTLMVDNGMTLTLYNNSFVE